jgi:tRNA-splicing endonuclease subunit Sen54
MRSARTTPLPTLQDLAALFDVLPEMPTPPPRRRNPQTLRPPGPDSQPVSNTAQSTISTLSTPPSPPPSFTWRLLQWVFPSKPEDGISTSKNAIVKPNPFVILKHGKKFAVVAAVDMGNISFFKFGQGDFSEYPIV